MKRTFRKSFLLPVISAALVAMLSLFGNHTALRAVATSEALAQSTFKDFFKLPKPAGNRNQQGTQIDPQTNLDEFYRPPPSKTYLINGLASNVEIIGYGFRNLSRKIPGSELHNYASFIESSTLIRSQVTREIRRAYARDPRLQINLIGISFGANIVTLIAADLALRNIPINYLATMEGPAMVPIRSNVRIADSFSCTNLDCFRTRSFLSWGNRITRHQHFRIKSSHIPLADHPQVHRRILNQINQSIAWN